MKNTLMIIILGALLFGGGYFVFSGSGNDQTINGSSVQVGSGEIQKIILSEKNYNYYPNEIKVKAGQPVSLSLDKSVAGCLRSFTIQDLGVAKHLRTPSDTLEFTPTKAGAYTFACSMGMGYGKLIVE